MKIKSKWQLRLKKSMALKIVLLFVTLVICIILTVAVYAAIEAIQRWLFVPREYLAFGMTATKLVLFFEVEIIFLAFFWLQKVFHLFHFNNIIPESKKKRFKWVTGTGLAVANAVLLTICIISVTIVTEDGIYIRDIGHIKQEYYEFGQVKKVETGYEKKGRQKGFFYYQVSMDDGQKIDLTNCVQNNQLDNKDGESDTSNSYTWLETTDRYIMEHDVIKKADQGSEKDSYDYAQVYRDLFLRVMENK